MKTYLTWLLIAVVSAPLVIGCKRQRQPTSSAARAAGDKVIARGQAAPLAMTNSYQTPASYFDKITSFPAWRTVPRGPQVFNGIPLDIGGMICLWGENNEKKLHLSFPEICPDIAMHQKLETLYVFHGTFFSERNGVPVCAVVFRYSDGSAFTNQLVYGEDMLDWAANRGKRVIGPTNPRSKLAWVGGSFSPDHPEKSGRLRLCLTAVDNPQPDLTVETVDLLSCKSKAAACILAVTPGKGGLMKDREVE
ncbi:MAG TPA: hypothetical protein VF988_16270 [Verrucomicrobiae bacterium]